MNKTMLKILDNEIKILNDVITDFKTAEKFLTPDNLQKEKLTLNLKIAGANNRHIFSIIGQLFSSTLSSSLTFYRMIYEKGNLLRKHHQLSDKYIPIQYDRYLQDLQRKKLLTLPNLKLAQKGIKEYIKFVIELKKTLEKSKKMNFTSEQEKEIIHFAKFCKKTRNSIRQIEKLIKFGKIGKFIK